MNTISKEKYGDTSRGKAVPSPVVPNSVHSTTVTINGGVNSNGQVNIPPPPPAPEINSI